jgi:hypothetical protein
VLALAPRPRDCARGALVQAATTLALFAPFLGDFHMLAYHWQIGSGTLLSHVLATGTAFGWPLRVAQAAVTVGAAVVVARLVRRRPEAVWLVPLDVALVRLVLDPVDNPWYWDAPTTVALVGGAAFLASREELHVRREWVARLRRRLAHGGAEMDQRDDALVVP